MKRTNESFTKQKRGARWPMEPFPFPRPSFPSLPEPIKSDRHGEPAGSEDRVERDRREPEAAEPMATPAASD